MNKPQLLRLSIPLLMAWSVAWLIGISVLAKVAIDLRAERRDADLDTQLALYATAVYGLTWFDSAGQFQDELFWLEKDLHPAPYDIWVVEPQNPPIKYLSPVKPHFSIPDFNFLAPPVMQQAQKVYLNGIDTQGLPYRLYAIPTYLDQADSTAPKAMIIVLADPNPGQQAYTTFVQGIVLTATLLGLVGLVVGVGLTYWSLRPAFQSLRQRERFLSATAHELRTPVAALRSVCESALQGDEVPIQALKRMDKLLHTTGQILEDLLLFARLDAGASLELQAVRLDLLVESLLPEEEDITFEATASVVNIDPRLVTVVIRNLIANARKYGKPPVHISVAGAQLVVEDQGQGFSAELLKRRDKDFALSPTQAGTGLGLAIVNLIARLHGGSLTLANRTPQGARVTVSFR